MEQIDSLSARLNILLSDFANLVADVSRLHRLQSSATEPRFMSEGAKRNTFDQLAVGGRFG